MIESQTGLEHPVGLPTCVVELDTPLLCVDRQWKVDLDMDEMAGLGSREAWLGWYRYPLSQLGSSASLRLTSLKQLTSRLRMALMWLRPAPFKSTQMAVSPRVRATEMKCEVTKDPGDSKASVMMTSDPSQGRPS